MKKFIGKAFLGLVLAGAVILGLWQWKQYEENKDCVGVNYSNREILICGSENNENGKTIKVLSGQKIEEVLKFFEQKGIFRQVSRVDIALSDSPDFKVKLEGRTDPATGEVLTAYGWEYENNRLRVFLFVKDGFWDQLTADDIDSMVWVSVWYFMAGSKLWNQGGDFDFEAIKVFRVNNLINHERLVEVI